MDRFGLYLLVAFSAILLQIGSAQTTVHVVGDGFGWTLPPNASFYSDWASGKHFHVGDILVFNFFTGRDDVVRVPKASYDVCSDDNDLIDIDNGPWNYTLPAVGDYYFLSGEDGRCRAGQRLAITVVSHSNSPLPSPGVNPAFPPRTAPVPSTVPTAYVVGDSLGWTLPPNVSFYSEWAAGKIFHAGDILVFNFFGGENDVVRVPKASYDVCSDDNEFTDIDNGPWNFTLPAVGDYYFISGEDGRCRAGQRLVITVVAHSNQPIFPPRTSPVLPPTTAPVPTAAPTQHVVGDSLGWVIPPNATAYQDWAANKTFRVGDSLLFNFRTDEQDVVQVRNKIAYDACNDDDEILDIDNGPATIPLTNAGDYFFICSVDRHCESGQKLTITVVAPTSGGSGNSPASGLNSPPSPPSNSATTSYAASLFLVSLPIIGAAMIL